MATILGDLLASDLVVVGGLVPSLLIAQDPLPEGVPPHAGTMDLDLGLNLALLDGGRYAEIARRMRGAGFEAQQNASGNKIVQTWTMATAGAARVTVDFLISPSSSKELPSRIKHLEPDFGAVITPGLDLAFRDRELVSLRGVTTMGEAAERLIPVCGPGAFVVLKALAFRSRGEPKDAYDLYYTIRNFGSGPGEVAKRLSSLRPNPWVDEALSMLRTDFSTPEGLGPARAARFVGDQADGFLRQDVVAFVLELIDYTQRRAQEDS